MAEISLLQAGGLTAAAAVGTWLIRWRRAGYTELHDTLVEVRGGWDSALKQIDALTQRLNVAEAARAAADQRASAAEQRTLHGDNVRWAAEREAVQRVDQLLDEIRGLRALLQAAQASHIPPGPVIELARDPSG